MVKHVQKTYTIARKLSAEITGLLYDLKELISVYRGNLIALVIGLLFLFLTNIEIIQVCILHVKIYFKNIYFKK